MNKKIYEKTLGEKEIIGERQTEKVSYRADVHWTCKQIEM